MNDDLCYVGMVYISCTKVWIIQKKAPNMRYGTKNKTTQSIHQKIH
jgi:hypothetical protein